MIEGRERFLSLFRLPTLVPALPVAIAIALASGCAPDAQAPAGAPRDAAAAAEPDPLIPLKTLFSSGSYDAAQISPDGKWITYLGPLDGVENFFVVPADDPAAAPRALTHKTGRGVQARDVSGNVMYRFTPDSRYLIYPQDQNGDENWNLYAIDLATGEERNTTKLDGATVELLALSEREPGRVLISVRAKMVAPPELHTLDLATGERQLVAAADPQLLGYIADHDLAPRMRTG